MTLDRNNNADGTGKYALVGLRKLNDAACPAEYRQCYETLKAAGIITTGAESPGDQFFVMKYKDIFTSHGLKGYAEAVKVKAQQTREVLELQTNTDGIDAPALQARLEGRARHLEEYAAQINAEAMAASAVEHKLPD